MRLRQLHHRLKAKNRHGIHSPLVYRLVDEVLLRPDGSPVRQRLHRFFAGWQWAEGSPDQPELITAYLMVPDAVVYIVQPHQNENGWTAAAQHPAVSIAIDCWDFGLLLRTSDVKEQQYFRLQYQP